MTLPNCSEAMRVHVVDIELAFVVQWPVAESVFEHKSLYGVRGILIRATEPGKFNHFVREKDVLILVYHFQKVFVNYYCNNNY